MEQNDKIQLFENQRIRTTWDEKKSGIFSGVDVLVVLTNQSNQRYTAKHWSVLKMWLKKRGAS